MSSNPVPALSKISRDEIALGDGTFLINRAEGERMASRIGNCSVTMRQMLDDNEADYRD